MSTPLEPVDPEQAQKVDPIDNITEHLELFWAKYQNLVYGIIIAVLLVIIGKGVWDWNVERRERAIGAEYAQAGSSVDKLRAFAATHEGHVLAGVSQLRIADEAYSAGRFGEAQLAYDKAVAVLADSPFVGRARLGSAISLVQQGKGSEAEPVLRRLADDATQFKVLRAEAAYHLASLHVEASRTEEARKACDLVLQIDAQGFWARRAGQLLETLPVVEAPAKTEASGDLKLTLPPAK